MKLVLHTKYFKQALFLRYPVSLAQNIKQSTLAVFKSIFFIIYLVLTKLMKTFFVLAEWFIGVRY